MDGKGSRSGRLYCRDRIYDRKYAISLLHQKSKVTNSVKAKVRPCAQVYDEQFRQVLLYIWYTAIQVCLKRLVLFLPDLVAAMERHGHLCINADIRHKLEKISAATVNRLFQPERRQTVNRISLLYAPKKSEASYVGAIRGCSN